MRTETIEAIEGLGRFAGELSIATYLCASILTRSRFAQFFDVLRGTATPPAAWSDLKQSKQTVVMTQFSARRYQDEAIAGDSPATRKLLEIAQEVADADGQVDLGKLLRRIHNFAGKEAFPDTLGVDASVTWMERKWQLMTLALQGTRGRLDDGQLVWVQSGKDE